MDFSWSQYDFFRLKKLPENNVRNLSCAELTCAVAESNGNRTFFGDASGKVTVLSSGANSDRVSSTSSSQNAVDYEERKYRSRSFKAHDRLVSHLFFVEAKSFLVTIGDGSDHRSDGARADAAAAAALGKKKASASRARDYDGDTIAEMNASVKIPGSNVSSSPMLVGAVVKIWKFADAEEEGDSSPLTPVRIFKVFARGEKELAITSMALSEDAQYLAVGFVDGSIRLFYGKSIFEHRGWGISIGISNDAPPFVTIDNRDAESAVSSVYFTTSKRSSSVVRSDRSGGSESSGKTQRSRLLQAVLFVVHAGDDGGVVSYRMSVDATSSPPSNVTRSMVVLEQRGSHCATIGSMVARSRAKSRARSSSRGGEVVGGALDGSSSSSGGGKGGGGGAGGFGSRTQRRLLVGMPEAVYFFSAEDRGQCYAFGGSIACMAWYRQYLLILKKAGSSSGASKREGGDEDIFSAYDLGNRLESAHFSFPKRKSIRFVLPQPSLRRIVLWTWSNELWEMQERPLSVKVDMLFADSLFPLALSVIRSSEAVARDEATVWGLASRGSGGAAKSRRAAVATADTSLGPSSKKDPVADEENDVESLVVSVHKMYGDHLYDKGEFDEAVEQYVATIGHLEPSYVIRRFLDTQCSAHLAKYVEQLHHHNRAGAAHTALLLNCYTKTRNRKALRQFVRQEGPWAVPDGDVGTGGTMVKASFNVDAAIRTLRVAGFYDSALYLAARYEKHECYCDIQISECDAVEDAMDYIENLPGDAEDSTEIMRRHCSRLLPAIPDRVTTFLEKLCTTTDVLGSSTDTAAATKKTKKGGGGVVSLGGKSPSSTGSTSVAATRWICRPEDFFHSFVEHPKHLKRLLESCLMGPTKSAASLRKEPWNTLIELVLQEMDAHVAAGQEREAASCKEQLLTILRLPSREAVFDREFALCLFELHEFREGRIHMYLSLGMYEAALACHIESRNAEKMIQICERHGEKEPGLWIQLLSGMAQHNMSPDDLSKVLKRIDAQKLLPPMLVLKILLTSSATGGGGDGGALMLASPRSTTSASSRGNTGVRAGPISFGAVKSYLRSHFTREFGEIKSNEREIDALKTKASELNDTYRSMQTTAKIFSSCKCSRTQLPLQFPTVHFMDGTSYNATSLNRSLESPSISRELSNIDRIRSQLRRKAAQHERFFEELEHAPDGFSKIAEYFGRGVFQKYDDESGEGSVA